LVVGFVWKIEAIFNLDSLPILAFLAIVPMARWPDDPILSFRAQRNNRLRCISRGLTALRFSPVGEEERWRL